MTEREYITIACAEIGQDLADEGRAFEQKWLRCYTQWADAVEMFGLDKASELVRQSYNRRAAERLEELETALESAE